MLMRMSWMGPGGKADRLACKRNNVAISKERAIFAPCTVPMLSTLKQKSDLLGAAASFLCLIHCIATPFLFVAAACTEACCASAPAWWRWIDIGFLIIAFFAVFRSARKGTNRVLKTGLWISWVGLAVFVTNEQLALFPVSHYFKYGSGLALITFHLLNLRHCRCQADGCCAAHG